MTGLYTDRRDLPKTEAYRLDVENMWGSVPPKAFEKAHSTIGAFEKYEIDAVGEFMAKHFDTRQQGRLVMLGCATGFREMRALKHARSFSDEPQHLSQMVAIDIAPQFLQRAARRLSMLQTKGYVDDARSHLCSLENVDLHHISKPHGGVVALTVYDLQCLLHRDLDSGEPVGLKEYGDNMHEILGCHTSIHPLRYRDHHITEGDAIFDYNSEDTRKSGAQYEVIRKQLQAYVGGQPDLLGLRIHIAKERDTLSRQTTNPLFISTWFSIPKLRELFEEYKLCVDEKRTSSCKGSILVLSSALEPMNGEKFQCCALAMNNVMGNLATPKMMSYFVHSLWRFCSPGVSYGPI